MDLPLDDRMKAHVQKLIDGISSAFAAIPDGLEREMIGRVGVDSAAKIIALQARMRPFVHKSGRDLEPLIEIVSEYTNEVCRAVGAYVLKTATKKARGN